MADTIDPTRLGVADTVRLTTSGALTASAAVEASLARIADLDAQLNAFSVVLADEARAEAAERDRALAAGEAPGPLHGVPVAIKEEVDVAGCVTTYGGVANSTPEAADGEVVRRLRAAGAVVVGKTTMPEFGAFPYTESVARGITHNPWDRSRTPGGSSGGTAVAVATGMVPVGIGGDGGGSIRIPSACCGLFGLKTQRGRVSTAPTEHLWWALGVVGPLTRSVLDSAMVNDVLRGNTDTDLFRAGPTGSFVEAAQRTPSRLRIGWSATSPTRGVKPDPLHVAALHEAATLLADLGHEVTEVDPRYPDTTLAFVPQFFAGIRTEADAMEHYERLERRTRQSYRMGTWVRPGVLSWALKQGEKVAEKANRVFDDCDVLLTPTIAHRPPKIGVITGKGTVRSSLAALPAISYAALWNVTGNPAASIPCGIGPDGLPTAVQLVGRTDDETTLLSLAAQMESTRPWPRWEP